MRKRPTAPHKSHIACKVPALIGQTRSLASLRPAPRPFTPARPASRQAEAPAARAARAAPIVSATRAMAAPAGTRALPAASANSKPAAGGSAFPAAAPSGVLTSARVFPAIPHGFSAACMVDASVWRDSGDGWGGGGMAARRICLSHPDGTPPAPPKSRRRRPIAGNAAWRVRKHGQEAYFSVDGAGTRVRVAGVVYRDVRPPYRGEAPRLTTMSIMSYAYSNISEFVTT